VRALLTGSCDRAKICFGFSKFNMSPMTKTEQSNVDEPSTSRSIFAIYGTLSICFYLLALVGCSATLTPDRQQQVTGQSVPPIDISGWVTYTNADKRFAFRHPADWAVRPADSADQQYSVIALIYDKEQAKALRECDKKHIIDTDPACRHWYREAMIRVRDYGYITYPNLDALQREKYALR
jgi:hypothetical protein